MERTTRPEGLEVDEEEWQRALHLAALSDYCIYDPLEEDGDDDSNARAGGSTAALVVKGCDLRDFKLALHQRDQLQLGFADSSDALLDLIWNLLRFRPGDRLSVGEAKKHEYFRGIDGWEGEQGVVIAELESSLAGDVVIGEDRSLPSPDISANNDNNGNSKNSNNNNNKLAVNNNDINKLALVSKPRHNLIPTPVADPIENMTFVCPLCGREFSSIAGCLKVSDRRA